MESMIQIGGVNLKDAEKAGKIIDNILKSNNEQKTKRVALEVLARYVTAPPVEGTVISDSTFTTMPAPKKAAKTKEK